MSGYSTIRKNLAADLIKAILDNSDSYFEQLVKKLLESMNYGDVSVVGGPGDKGVDGILRQDILGVDKIVLQAKRYAEGNPITSDMARSFIGAVQSSGTKKGIFITTSRFTRDAVEVVDRSHLAIVLIDGTKLAELMIDHNVGVSTESKYEIKRIDTDFFTEEWET